MKKRLLDRLRGRPSGAWSAQLEEIWPELEPQAGGQGELLAATITATWEVGLADIGRQARSSHPALSAQLVARASDALVPLLTPVQVLPSALEDAVRQGGVQAQTSGSLLDAFAPTVAVVNGVGESLEGGWAQLVPYLELGPIESLRPKLLAQGLELRAHSHAAARSFHQACGELAVNPKPALAFMDALDQWRRDLARSLEIELYGTRTLIIAALKA